MANGGEIMAVIIRNAFYDGIKPTFDPLVIPDNAVWKANNARSDVSGILRLREGSINIFPSLGDNNVQSFVYAFEQLLFVWGKKVYKYDRETDVLALIEDVDVSTNETENVTMLRWSTSGTEVVYIFGGNGIFQTDGNTVTPVTPYIPDGGEPGNLLSNPIGPGNCKLATLKYSLSQRLCVAGLPEAPNTVYMSAPLDASYFPDDQVIQLPDDGAVITGLTNWNNVLVIFRDKDIWAFFGTDLTDPSAALVLQDGSIGCIAQKTITHVPELGICFVGQDNIYALRNVTGIENQAKAIPISDDVTTQVRKAISYGDLEDVAGVYFNREYRVCFPKAETDERIFRLTLRNGMAWYTDNGPLTNNYIAIKGELFGSYYKQGSLHQITEDTVFDETVYVTSTFFAEEFNNFMFNESSTSETSRELSGIPFSITFRRENLQPGPARIKRVFLYVLSMGKREARLSSHFGPVFNEVPFNEPSVTSTIVDTSTNQTFDLTLIVDGNEIQVDYIEVFSKKVPETFLARSEPLRIYEAIIRPSLKGHFMQIKLEAKTAGELVGVLGYGIDYQPKGRTRGIRDGVSNNKA